MYLNVGAQAQAPTAAGGLGAIGPNPRIVRRADGRPVLRLTVPLLVRRFPRGMGGLGVTAPIGCPVVGAPGPDALCNLDGAIVGCRNVRECDPMTGQVHFEYALPGGPDANADISVVNPNSGAVIAYQGAPASFAQTGPLIPVGTLVERGGNTVFNYPGSGITTGGTPSAGAPLLLNAVDPATGGKTYPGSATLENLTRGGGNFQVGDQWRLTILGAPGGAVTVSTTQNGKSLADTSYGATDSTGKQVLSGTMTPDTLGAWVEHWSVGGVPVGVVSFTVAAASSSAPPGGGAGSNSGNTSSSGNGGSSPALPSILSGSISLFGFSLPVWGVGLAAVAGLALLAGGHKR